MTCDAQPIQTVMAVVGARPNFMKTVPVLAALRRRRPDVRRVLVHTGQHYDDEMSRVFLEQLGCGAPDHMLDVGSGTHAVQTARVMERIEPVIERERPDVVLVPGDVNSTLAAALVAAKLEVPVAHLEAGLRSFDRTMPEELNRVLTDAIADVLFIHSPEARDHLLAEGRPADRIHAVGNTMIDTLVAMRPRFEPLRMAERLGLGDGGYLMATLHRPALVDGPLLEAAVSALEALADELPVVFPAHPRTRAAMERAGLRPSNPRLRIVEPLGYLEFLGLVASSAGALTDSGGLQEETTYLGIPCFTLRDNTERPVTCDVGTNVLLGLDPARILEIPALLAELRGREAQVPAGWDGHAADRVVDVLEAGIAPRARPRVVPVA